MSNDTRPQLHTSNTQIGQIVSELEAKVKSFGLNQEYQLPNSRWFVNKFPYRNSRFQPNEVRRRFTRDLGHKALMEVLVGYSDVRREIGLVLEIGYFRNRYSDTPTARFTASETPAQATNTANKYLLRVLPSVQNALKELSPALRQYINREIVGF